MSLGSDGIVNRLGLLSLIHYVLSGLVKLVTSCTTNEDITQMDTHNTFQFAMRGVITRERARQINLQVTSFLRTLFHDYYMNKLLPNDIIIRKYLDFYVLSSSCLCSSIHMQGLALSARSIRLGHG